MCLAKNIRYLRKKYDYSQDYIAEKLGYKSFTTVQKWESGIAEPSIIVLRKLADLFNVDMNAMTTIDLELQDAEEEALKGHATFYTNEETQQIAQEVYENPDLKLVFDACKDLTPEQIQAAAALLKIFKGGQ